MKTYINKFKPFLFAAVFALTVFGISAQAQMMMAKKGAPTVVMIKATWCGACQKVDPIMRQLRSDYGGKLHFVVFDVSDEAAEARSAAKAKSLGLSSFFQANKKKTSTVAIFDKAKKKVFTTNHNYDREAYVAAFDKALK